MEEKEEKKHCTFTLTTNMPIILFKILSKILSNILALLFIV